MDNEEIIELFFSKYNEQAFNEKILEDIDYEIPHDLVLNYVRSVIQVPFNEYVDYIITHTDDEFDPIEIEGIPTFYNLVDCRERMIDLMLMEDNRGLKLMEIGSYIKTHSISMNPGYTVVGRKSIQVAETLGIVYEYYNHWYLNCVAYVFDELSRQELQAFYARAILRNSFVKMLLVLCSQGRVSIYDFLFDPYQEVNISTLRSIEFWHSTLHRAICKPYHLHEIEELEELHEREEKKAMSAVRGDLWSRKTDFDVSSYVDEVCVAEVDLNDPLAYEPKDSMGNPLTYSQAPDGVWVKGYAYSTYSREVPSMVDNNGYYRTGPLPDFTREIAILLRDRDSYQGTKNKERMDAYVVSQMLDNHERRKYEYEPPEDLEESSAVDEAKRQKLLESRKVYLERQKQLSAKREDEKKARIEKRLKHNAERKNKMRAQKELAEKRRQERIEREKMAQLRKFQEEQQREKEREAIKREYSARKEREYAARKDNEQPEQSQTKSRVKRNSVYARGREFLERNGRRNTNLHSVNESETANYKKPVIEVPQKQTTKPSALSTNDPRKLSATDLLKLSKLFKNVSTTYKFFWMLALIDATESPSFNGKLVMRSITARMVANAWIALAHGINFPKLDKLPSVIAEAQKYNINTSTKQEIFRGIYAIQDTNFHRLMDQLEANVPFRFLSPWIPYSSDQQVVKDSNDKTKKAPYSIKKQGRASEIQITEVWQEYFRTSASTLRQMTYSVLTKYLHSCNPSQTEDEIAGILHE